MRRIAITAALLATAVASPALAQDAGPLTGVRAGGLVGYDRPEAGGGSVDGVVYGGFVGYDYQRGNVTAGVEAELTESNIDECISDASGSLCTNFKRDIYGGFRIGGAIGDSGLVYLKAGYTNAKIGASVNIPGTVASGSDTLDGIRVGGGVEFGFPAISFGGGGAFIKGEYRYSNYSDGFERHQAVAGIGFRF